MEMEKSAGLPIQSQIGLPASFEFFPDILGEGDNFQSGLFALIGGQDTAAAAPAEYGQVSAFSRWQKIEGHGQIDQVFQVGRH